MSIAWSWQRCGNDCPKIIRNIAARYKICWWSCLSRYLHSPMSLNHATVTHLCGRPHAWYRTNTIYCRCLTPLSIGNDTNICPTCLLVAYQQGWWKHDARYNRCFAMLSFDHTYLIQTQSIACIRMYIYSQPTYIQLLLTFQ